MRPALINQIADLVPGGPGSVRVAVDGVDGVGKSTFAAHLAGELSDRGRPVVHVSADDFHHPRVIRYRRGRDSPEGFFLDSYDYSALVREVLEPFAPGGSRRFRRAAHDVRTDEALDLDWEVAPEGTVLVVDGLFLHRDELAGLFEFSVFLDAPFEVTVPRMAARDGSHPDPRHPSLARYVGGQRLYFATCDPHSRAGVVIDNSDWRNPAILPR
ncbi:uridine kinase [Paractinoplanes atraurantiacus]|uniref:uridine kinase n=1 Tax=Paractinoplanes atraurantiacus TaxID=1036182 RepID=UPI001178894A|nr:uridine kinase [Actinoplanes atraurantiacus]